MIQNMITFLIWGSVISFLILLGVIFWIKKDDIDTFLHPENWNHIIMKESDNNISQWNEKKNEELVFTFNKGRYNMFTAEKVLDEQGNPVMESVTGPDGQIRQIPKIQKNTTTTYRDGRLSCFVYVEGNRDPIDISLKQTKGDAQVSEQLLKIGISRLFQLSGDLGRELLMQWGFFILCGIVILLLIIVFKGNGSAPAQVPVKG